MNSNLVWGIIVLLILAGTNILLLLKNIKNKKTNDEIFARQQSVTSAAIEQITTATTAMNHARYKLEQQADIFEKKANLIREEQKQVNQSSSEAAVTAGFVRKSQ